MTRWLGNTVAANVWSASMWSAEGEDPGERWNDARYYWSINFRQPDQANHYPNGGWATGWRRSGIIDGGAGINLMSGSDPSNSLADMFSYEPWEPGYGGAMRPYYIKGQCIDSNGVAVTSAALDAFRTATDTWEGSALSDNQGFFSIPVLNNPSPNAYYVVAYRAGAPDISGTTVNTLTAVL